MFTSLVEYLIAPVSLFFCGQLGKTELAAAGLAISVFHTAGVSFIMGLLTASETLFAQASLMNNSVDRHPEGSIRKKNGSRGYVREKRISFIAYFRSVTITFLKISCTDREDGEFNIIATTISIPSPVCPDSLLLFQPDEVVQFTFGPPSHPPLIGITTHQIQGLLYYGY